MGKIKYIIAEIDDVRAGDLVSKKIVSAVKMQGAIIVGRYGVNSTTLRKILKKHLSK